VASSAVFQTTQWAEKGSRDDGKSIKNRTQLELVPNEASKSNIVRGALEAGTAAIEAMLAADAEQFCGKRYQRHADRQGYRWGMIGSEVGWHGGQAAIRRPRVRERGGAEVELPSWRAISGARPTSATISATISSPTSLRVCVTALSTAGLGTTWAPTKIRDIAANDQI
jgi:hypothetical protein